jgi:hypothetical protein
LSAYTIYPVCILWALIRLLWNLVSLGNA